MTMRQFLNGVIYAGSVAAALMGIGAFLHFAVVRPMRNFLRNEIGGAIKQTTEAVEALSRKLNGHLDEAVERDKKIDSLTKKIDDHISNGGHVKGSRE